MNKKEYNKEHYRAFKVDLKIKEYDELNEILKHDKVSKASFLRYAISEFKRARKYIAYKDVINKEE